MNGDRCHQCVSRNVTGVGNDSLRGPEFTAMIEARGRESMGL